MLKNIFLPVSFNSVWSTNAIRRAGPTEIFLQNQDLMRIAPFEKQPYINVCKISKTLVHKGVHGVPPVYGGKNKRLKRNQQITANSCFKFGT